MTEPKSCQIDGCGKIVYALGLCPAHYTRQRRHGTPLGGGPAYAEAQDFLEAHRHDVSDECLLWPFARDRKGYGIVWFRDHQTTANFAMCAIAHGEPPTPLHESAHSCGRGHEGCINPGHLRWATRSENHADKLIHGTHSRGARNQNVRLSEDDVRVIRHLEGTVRQRVLAAHFDVTIATVSAIQRRKIWAWLPQEIAA